jgi:hypothetical protein
MDVSSIQLVRDLPWQAIETLVIDGTRRKLVPYDKDSLHIPLTPTRTVSSQPPR